MALQLHLPHPSPPNALFLTAAPHPCSAPSCTHRWARATSSQPDGLKVHATEKLGMYSTLSSGVGKSGMELATAGGSEGGLSTDAIAVAPGGMPNPLVFAASGTDTNTQLVGRRTNVGLPSYLL